MTYISIEGWAKLLVVNVDEQANTWFEPSMVDPPVSNLLHTYTLRELLKEWKSIRRH
jgi:hypothetical protein